MHALGVSSSSILKLNETSARSQPELDIPYQPANFARNWVGVCWRKFCYSDRIQRISIRRAEQVTCADTNDIGPATESVHRCSCL
jgi:hypothetical protein